MKKKSILVEKAKSVAERLIGFGMLLIPLAVHAQLTPGVPVGNLGSVEDKICLATKWIFTGAIIFGVIFILVAAFSYLTAGGESEKVKSAHKKLIWGVVGIAVAILAAGVPFIVGNFLGNTTSLTVCGFS